MDDDGSGVLPGSRNQKRELRLWSVHAPSLREQPSSSFLLLQVAASKDPVANATRRDDVEFDHDSAGDVDLGE